MAALSETRLADVGEAAEANYTFFWSGRAPHLKREAGVGFAIKTSLVPKLIGKPKAINDRLMTAQFLLTKRKQTLCYTNKCLTKIKKSYILNSEL